MTTRCLLPMLFYCSLFIYIFVYVFMYLFIYLFVIDSLTKPKAQYFAHVGWPVSTWDVPFSSSQHWVCKHLLQYLILTQGIHIQVSVQTHELSEPTETPLYPSLCASIH